MSISRVLRYTAVGVVAGICGAGAVLLGQRQTIHLKPVDMTYADLAATLLGAAALITTVVGLGIAALAVWGFTALRGLAKNSAKSHVASEIRNGALRTHVETVVTEFLDREFQDGDLRRLLEDRVDRIILTAPADRAAEGTSDDDAPVGDL